MRAFEGACKADEITKNIVLGAHIKYDLTAGFISPTVLKDPTAPNVNNLVVYDILYADDCVIFCNSETGLQIMMDTLDRIATEYGMKIAIKKPKYYAIASLPD